MATILVTTIRTTAVGLLTGDQLLVSRTGAILTAANAVAGTGTGSATRVSIDGEVTALGSNTAVLLTMTSLGSNSTTGIGNHIISIGSGGLVRSEGNRGVFVAGTGNTVLNAGEIMAQGDGVELTGADGIIRNWGTVSSSVDAALTTRGGTSEITNAGSLFGLTGILSSGANATIRNGGTIDARTDGIYSFGQSAFITNTGIIRGGEFAVLAETFTVLSNTGTLVADTQMAVALLDGGLVSNSGLIQGVNGGISAAGLTELDLLNTGRIVAFDRAVSFRTGVVTNEGEIASSGDAIYVSGGGSVLIVNSGLVTARDNGILTVSGTSYDLRNDGTIIAGLYGIQAASDNLYLRNTGDIRASNGMFGDGTGSRIVNTGEIEASFSGMIAFGNDTMLRNSGSITADTGTGLFSLGLRGLQVINSGSITSGRDGIAVEQNSSTDPAAMVRNAGTIVAEQFGVASLSLDSGLNFRNTGLVQGEQVGVSAQNGVSDIVNLGTIAAGPGADGSRGTAVSLGGGADTVHNGGTILGRVEMGAGNDRVSNAGWIDGDVRLGDGNDSYQAHRSGVAAHVLGGAGNDTLRGATGADRLSGEAGADVLAGGAGDDTLSGGLGRDILTGGTGADLFVFASRFESPSGAGRDAITDFTPGQDRIDVSAFMAGAVYLGSAAFSGTGRALRFDTASGLLEGDSNSDGTADWQVQLTTGLVLSAADFVL